MDPRNRDERTKTAAEARAVASDRRTSAATAVLLFLALALVVDGVVGERGWLANRRGHEKVAEAERQLQLVNAQNAMLANYAKRLKEKDPATFEDLARRERGFIKPGEKLFIVKDVRPEK